MIAEVVKVFRRSQGVDDDGIEVGERGKSDERTPLELCVVNVEDSLGCGVEHGALDQVGLLSMVEARVVDDGRGGHDQSVNPYSPDGVHGSSPEQGVAPGRVLTPKDIQRDTRFLQQLVGHAQKIGDNGQRCPLREKARKIDPGGGIIEHHRSSWSNELERRMGQRILAFDALGLPKECICLEKTRRECSGMTPRPAKDALGAQGLQIAPNRHGTDAEMVDNIFDPDRTFGYDHFGDVTLSLSLSVNSTLVFLTGDRQSLSSLRADAQGQCLKHPATH